MMEPYNMNPNNLMRVATAGISQTTEQPPIERCRVLTFGNKSDSFAFFSF